MNLKALGVAAFPGGRAQIAGGHFALAGIELRDLAEFQRVALAGIAIEIVQNAPADRRDLRGIARAAERQIVNRPMRSEHDRRLLRLTGEGRERRRREDER